MPWFCLPKLSFSSTALYSAVWAAYVFFILTIMKCPDSVVTVTDFLEQTQLPIDRNLPKTESVGVLQFVSVSEKPGSACRVPLQSSPAQQRDPGRANKRQLPAPRSQVYSYWNKQLLMWSRDMCLEGDVSLGSLFLSIALSSCCYTERSMSSIFLFLFSVIWNWNAILSERWLFSVGQY